MTDCHRHFLCQGETIDNYMYNRYIDDSEARPEIDLVLNDNNVEDDSIWRDGTMSSSTEWSGRNPTHYKMNQFHFPTRANVGASGGSGERQLLNGEWMRKNVFRWPMVGMVVWRGLPTRQVLKGYSRNSRLFSFCAAAFLMRFIAIYIHSIIIWGIHFILFTSINNLTWGWMNGGM